MERAQFGGLRSSLRNMEQVLNVAGMVAIPLVIAGVIAAAITYWFSMGLSSAREAMRTLRTALERDPSPAQLAESLRNWPSAANLPGQHQVNEFKRLAGIEEGKRAARFEQSKSLCRFFVILAFLGVVAWFAAKYIGPQVAEK